MHKKAIVQSCAHMHDIVLIYYAERFHTLFSIFERDNEDIGAIERGFNVIEMYLGGFSNYEDEDENENEL